MNGWKWFLMSRFVHVDIKLWRLIEHDEDYQKCNTVFCEEKHDISSKTNNIKLWHFNKLSVTIIHHRINHFWLKYCTSSTALFMSIKIANIDMEWKCLRWKPKFSKSTKTLRQPIRILKASSPHSSFKFSFFMLCFFLSHEKIYKTGDNLILKLDFKYSLAQFDEFTAFIRQNKNLVLNIADCVRNGDRAISRIFN